MSIKKTLLGMDYFLLLVVLIIFSIGVVTVSSATDYDIFGMSRELKLQLVAFGIGMVAMLFLAFFDYRYFCSFYWLVYAASIGILLILYIPGVGVERGGALSWINLGVIDFQTSEIAKLGYIIFLAEFIKRRGGVNSMVDAILSGITVLPLFGLVMLQSDLGTAVVFLFITMGMIFVAGMKYWQILLFTAAGAVSFPFAFKKLGSYQQKRLIAFMYPDDLSLPGNYHVHMSKISIGSGQMYGKGIYGGVFHKLDYLPVRESDFIFAVFVEEFGYLGGMVVLILYFLLFSILLIDAFRVKDLAGSGIIIGVLFMMGFQTFENIGMNMGVMPVTGITLPFFSAGATSVVSSFLAIGLVQSVFVHRKKQRKVVL